MLNHRFVFYLVIFVAFLIATGCSKDVQDELKNPNALEIPEGFPSVVFPLGNEYTPERWALGKRLFYDPILSLSNKVSCASCHLASNAFSDTIPLSLGDNNEIGFSNSPTLANIAYHPYYTSAGGVPTLEMQILVPIQEHNEFNSNILDIVEELKLDPSYVSQIKIAYNREPDAFSITRAIANFERSLISGGSNFDNYTFRGNKEALTDIEQQGLKLFMSEKTNCSKCHSGFNFTNYAFENNGLYLNYIDSGRMRLTHLEEDRAKYKVPSLRNIALTKPYMHDGSFKTLKEVIEHYNSGGKNHTNKNGLIKPLNLTSEEKEQLIAFLNALTDHSFITNKLYRK